MRYIVYSPVCTPCKYRVALNTIRSFINLHGHSIEIRNTSSNRKNKTDAESIGQALPFVYNADTKQSTELLGVTYAELERIGRL